jgi:glycerol kinase
MNRRAAIYGLSFSTTKDHIVRAALESIPYQIKDVILAMEAVSGLKAGVYESVDHLQQLNSDRHTTIPVDVANAQTGYEGWKKVIACNK